MGREKTGKGKLGNRGKEKELTLFVVVTHLVGLAGDCLRLNDILNDLGRLARKSAALGRTSDRSVDGGEVFDKGRLLRLLGEAAGINSGVGEGSTGLLAVVSGLVAGAVFALSDVNGGVVVGATRVVIYRSL